MVEPRPQHLDLKRPCRSCNRNNNTTYTCSIPINEENQSGDGHILCGYCVQYFPVRGRNGTEPGLNQCCRVYLHILTPDDFKLTLLFPFLGSFCGVISCDEYWGCSSNSPEAKLYILKGILPVRIL